MRLGGPGDTIAFYIQTPGGSVWRRVGRRTRSRVARIKMRRVRGGRADIVGDDRLCIGRSEEKRDRNGVKVTAMSRQIYGAKRVRKPESQAGP